MDYQKYVSQVLGKKIDIDGMYGAQCWDLWAHYAIAGGVPSIKTFTWFGGRPPHDGWACNVYHNAHAAGLDEWFLILPKTAKPVKGDVVFWEYGSKVAPWSHVAIVHTVGEKTLNTLGQNAPVGHGVGFYSFPRDSVLGYLRPKFLNTTPSTPNVPTIPIQEETMKVEIFSRHDQNKRDTEWMIVHPDIGKDLRQYVGQTKNAEGKEVAKFIGPGVADTRKQGNLTIRRGHAMTTHEPTARAITRIYGVGLTNPLPKNSLPRNEYIEVQIVSSAVSKEMHG